MRKPCNLWGSTKIIRLIFLTFMAYKQKSINNKLKMRATSMFSWILSFSEITHICKSILSKVFVINLTTDFSESKFWWASTTQSEVKRSTKDTKKINTVRWSRTLRAPKIYWIGFFSRSDYSFFKVSTANLRFYKSTLNLARLLWTLTLSFFSSISHKL